MWKAGDRALCVDADGANIQWVPHYPAPDSVTANTIYLVEGVVFEEGITWLRLSVFPDTLFDQIHFRKIVPACDRASFSVEVTKEL